MEALLFWQVSNAVSSLGINTVLISHSTQLSMSFVCPAHHEELVDSGHHSESCRQDHPLPEMDQYESQQIMLTPHPPVSMKDSVGQSPNITRIIWLSGNHHRDLCPCLLFKQGDFKIETIS